MNVEIGAEDALFPEREYISGIFVAVQIKTKKFKKNCYAFFMHENKYK